MHSRAEQSTFGNVAYDEKLANRIRALLAKQTDDVSERRMFGGLCFMVDGGMCCGVLGEDLIVKVGKAQHEACLARPHARPFDFTGRVSRGIVYVGPEGTRAGASLAAWLRRCEALA